jgi:AraC family transcriptional regulator
LPQDRTSRTSTRRIIGEDENLHVALIDDRRGVVEFPGSPAVVVSIHVGTPVDVDCRHGGERHRGRAIHGDVEIIPPNVPAVWEIKDRDTALAIALGPKLLHRVVEDSGADPRHFEVRNCFQTRDSRIEHIAWALKAEMESGYPCGRLFMNSLAMGLAAVVVRKHSSLAHAGPEPRSAMPARNLKQALAYIEDNLNRSFGLGEIADACGLSVSHFRTQFRRAVGLPAHQYVIRRRVERAAMILRCGKLPIGRVALETGFCHQSHLAHHMRRVLGLSPREVRNDGH